MIAWSILLGAVTVVALVEGVLVVALFSWAVKAETRLAAATVSAAKLQAGHEATLIRERDAAGDLDRLCKRLDALEASERLQAIEHQIETLALKVELGG